MRIAAVSPFVDRRHGTERALAELLERLADQFGCEIHLYAQSVTQLRLNHAQADRKPGSGAIFWHKVPRLPAPHVFAFLSWMFFNTLLRRWHAWFGGRACDLVLSPGINCLDADVVIVHVLFTRLRELASTGNAAIPQTGILRKVHRRLYYRILAALERKLYSDKSTRLAAVSHRTARLLQSYFGRDDSIVIPNGVDTAQFSPATRCSLRAQARLSRGFRDDECVLALVGNDWTNKGLPAILDALAMLSAVSFRLIVMGDDHAEPFRARAKLLDLETRCFWQPPVVDVLDVYAASDIYLSPSREDSFGLPVAEAMACGLPVITSVFAGVSEFVQHGVNGFVLQNPLDAKDLAETLRHLQSRPEYRQKIGDAAAASIQSLTWDRNAEAVWKLLTARHPAAESAAEQNGRH